MDRERLTNWIRAEILNYSRANTGDIRPMNVQTRLPEDALYAKYFRPATVVEDGHSSGTSVSEEVKMEPTTSGSEEEKMEILIKPEDVRIEQKVYSGPRKQSKPSATITTQSKSGQSLLKPIHQRKIEDIETDVHPIRVVRPEIGLTNEVPVAAKPVEQQPAAISLIRLRLTAALSKAKDVNKGQQSQNRIESTSPETTLTVQCNTLSSSHSSNGSSLDIEPMKDEQDAQELGQEGFLRLFGLFTPAYTEYMMNRRPQRRKKRICTSTERGDFHYGKFELFERQFANKRQRQFLYSPPATRAKRRVASNALPKEPLVLPKKGKGIKSNASSSSSVSSNGSTQISTEKVCLSCYKRSEFSILFEFYSIRLVKNDN